MKNTLVSLSILVALSLAACGKKNEDRLPAEESVTSFTVNHSFQNPVYTRVVVMDVSQNSAHTKRLHFRAPARGTFTLSETNYAIGTGCTQQSAVANGDYEANFSYKIKDPRNNQYNLTPVFSNATGLMTSMAMNPGDELMVTMDIRGVSTCSMLEILLTAVFN